MSPNETKGCALYHEILSFEQTDQEYQKMKDLYLIESGKLPKLQNEYQALSAWNIDCGGFILGGSAEQGEKFLR